MLITLNAKLRNFWKDTKETKRESKEYVCAHIERLDEVAEKTYAPYGTKPGAYINFFERAYLFDGNDIIAGDHVKITFLLSCWEYQGNRYTKLTWVDIEKIDLQAPKNSLFDVDEDSPFDFNPDTGKVL